MHTSESDFSLPKALEIVHSASLDELRTYFEDTCTALNRLIECHAAFLNDDRHHAIRQLFQFFGNSLPDIEQDLSQAPRSCIPSSSSTDYWVRDALNSNSSLTTAFGERRWFTLLQSDPEYSKPIQQRVDACLESIRDHQQRNNISTRPLVLNLESPEEVKEGKNIINKQARLRAIELRVRERLPRTVPEENRPYVAATLVTILFYRHGRHVRRVPLAQIDTMISSLLSNCGLNAFDLALKWCKRFSWAEKCYSKPNLLDHCSYANGQLR
jgi:hypothetical protein